jgi:hypothetical protein
MTVHSRSRRRNGRTMEMATPQCCQIINTFISMTADDNNSSAIAFVITHYPVCSSSSKNRALASGLYISRSIASTIRAVPSVCSSD